MGSRSIKITKYRCKKVIDRTIDFFITFFTTVPVIILGIFGLWWGIESIKRNNCKKNCCKVSKKKL